MTAKEKEFDPQVLATTLMGCVSDTFINMCHVQFSKQPEYQENEIIEYNSRMRAFGLSKFNAPCYLSYINFFLDQKAYKKNDALGAMILYVEETCAEKLVKAMGETLDEDDTEIILDTIGEFGNVCAGQFKNELNNLGFTNLTISAPYKFKNDVPDGVIFNYNEHKYYELSYEVDGVKSIVVDMTMAPVPFKD